MASLQLPSTLKLNPVGGGWVHVPLTMPANIKGKGFQVYAVNFAYSTPVKNVTDAYYKRAIVDKVEIWDGNKKYSANQSCLGLGQKIWKCITP